MTIETFPLTTLGAAAAAVVETLEPTPERVEHAPGVYWNLSEDIYHADASLGSTDMRRLARDPRSFWWESRFNMMRDDDDEPDGNSEAKIVGRAMHAAVLEGREALEARFAPVYQSGATKAGKEERAAAVARGREPIKARHWRRAVLASSIIRADPEVGDAFHNTIATELSVFWTCPRSGIKKKARLDAVKPRAIVDFKTITNRDDVPFEELCCRHIGSYGYFTQAECYRDAWAQIPALIDAGAVFGAPSDDAVERLRLASPIELAAFVFVFLQKAGAPLVWGTTISPGNGILDNARDDIRRAEDNWRDCMERFGGTETPWIKSLPLAELDINDIPAWAFRRY